MSYIKIHREILDSYCFSSSNSLKIWIWLLVKANFKKSFCTLKAGKGEVTVEINRGQLLFGRFKAEDELGIDGSLIYRVIKKFEELGQIEIESNNQFSIITICKYEDYQGEINSNEQQTNSKRTTNEQRMNNKRTTNEQQTTTYKEGLEEIEEIEEIKNITGIPEFWNNEKKYFKNEEVYFSKICSEYKFTKNEILIFADEFLKERELSEDYKDLKELKRHFSFWVKKHKNGKIEKEYNPHTATGTEKAAQYKKMMREHIESQKSTQDDLNGVKFEDN